MEISSGVRAGESGELVANWGQAKWCDSMLNPGCLGKPYCALQVLQASAGTQCGELLPG